MKMNQILYGVGVIIIIGIILGESLLLGAVLLGVYILNCTPNLRAHIKIQLCNLQKQIFDFFQLQQK
jgi:hypothetical protein